jgi:hypothetical protein
VHFGDVLLLAHAHTGAVLVVDMADKVTSWYDICCAVAGMTYAVQWLPQWVQATACAPHPVCNTALRQQLRRWQLLVTSCWWPTEFVLHINQSVLAPRPSQP